MMKIYILYLFLIIFIIPTLFFKFGYIENFANKKKVKVKMSEEESIKQDKKQKKNLNKGSDEEYILTNNINSYTFMYKDKPFTIFPSNKTDKVSDIFFIFDSQDKNKIKNVKFNYEDPQNFKIKDGKETIKLSITMTDKPLTMVINNFDKTFDFEKASTGNKKDKKKETNVYNIIYFNTNIGNVKVEKENDVTNKITIKTKNKELQSNPNYLLAIFTGFLIFDSIKKISKIDYDKHYSK